MTNPQNFKFRIINTLFDIISIFIFPIIFSLKLKTHPFPSYKYVIIYISLIYIYKNIFIPKRPNLLFDECYASFLFIIIIIFGFKMNILISIITMVQLILFIFAKNYSKKFPILTDIVFNFIVPIFLMIVTTYSLTKFFSINYLVIILIINIITLISSYIEFNYQSLFEVIFIIFLLIIVYSLKYINIFNVFLFGIALLFFLFIKYSKKIPISSNILRLLLSLTQIL